MKQTVLIAAMLGVGVLCFAQDNLAIHKQKLDAELASQVKVLSVKGAMMGTVIKNAAYSGIEISEHSQTLFDGTEIRNENQTKVYRDNEGRVRRESQQEVNIWDPVSQVSYSLNPVTLIARRLPFAAGNTVAPGKDGTTILLRTLQGNSETKLEAEAVAREMAALQKLATEMGRTRSTRSEPGVQQLQEALTKAEETPLGTQKFDMVTAEGKRLTNTLPVNAIGNDRPITISTERWYSTELSLNVYTKRVDPRTGQDTFRLTNISRVEPVAEFFQVPPGYQLLERK